MDILDIPLNQVYPIEHPNEYKLHLARDNSIDRPLDVFIRSRDEWNGWNRYRGHINRFNRDFVFALIDFYPERDIWLFGGVYRVLSRAKDKDYEIELLEESKRFIGRLKISFSGPRNDSLLFDQWYDAMVVSEILPVPYSGEPFPGYDQINLSFPELENIILTQKPDWKTALETTQGIYMITDTLNGKRYVGSAYGSNGIWSRWRDYVDSQGHGGNTELSNVIKRTVNYARMNFQFTMLEAINLKVEEDIVIRREQHWKTVLLTQNKEYGYNLN